MGQRTRHFSKEDIQMANKIHGHHSLSEKCKSKHNEVPSLAGQNGWHQKVYKQYMLERVWIKVNPLTLLVGMQTSTTTMENSVEIH